MGCDIHIHAEVKIAGTWHYYGQVPCDRDYELFEKMAGVRGDESEAIAAPRGVPDDATFMTRFHEKWGGEDAHTKTWLTAGELQSVAEWYKEAAQRRGYSGVPWKGYLFGNYFQSFLKYPNDHPLELEDVRFVFWFDN